MLRGRASENSLNARLKKKAKPQGFEQAASLEADPSMLEKTKMKKKKSYTGARAQCLGQLDGATLGLRPGTVLLQEGSG